jgi:hypothetical protein
MSEMNDSGGAVETAESTAEATDTEPGEGNPAGGYVIGGPELERDIAIQEQKAGTRVASSGGGDHAGAAGGGKAGGDSKASADGKATAGQDAKAESAVEASRGSAGGETAAEPGEGMPAGVPTSDGYYIGGLELEKDVTIHKIQEGLKDHLDSPHTRNQFPDGYDSFHGGTPDQYFDKYTSGFDDYGQPNWNWPNETGAVEGSESPRELQPGTILDRYGTDQGKYMSPRGTSYPERALPASSLGGEYHQYKVVRPFTAIEGRTAAAFGEPGGGIQFRTDQKIAQLVKDRYLEEVKL